MTTGVAGPSSTEAIRIRAEACGKLVDQFIDNEFPLDEFLRRLRETGASLDEAKEYTEQAQARIAAAGKEKQPLPPPPPSQPGSREGTPEGLSERERDKFRADRDRLLEENRQREEERRRQAAEDVEWGVLRAKLGALFPHTPTRSALSPADLAQFLGLQVSQSTSPTTIPAATMALAPHLAQFTTGIKADTHIEETYKLRRAYGADKALDPIVDVMQLQPLVDPLPRTIWRSIIQDHYMDFEKLYASMGPGYDHQDDPKDFGGGYSLVKRDQISARRTIRFESEWIRVFAAWRTAVCFMYPHRILELSGYLQVVTDLFRAAPSDPTVAIRFDAEAREKYSKSPFHMDDRSQLNMSLLAQMFRYAPTQSASGKRTSVAIPTEPKTKTTATLRSKLDAERSLAEATDRVLQAAQGPRPFSSPSGTKRTAREAFLDSDDTHMPRFRRGFLWSSSSRNNISPAALYTETAPPLPSPPSHLVNNPAIQESLRAMRDHIKKEKPRVITDHKSSGLNDGIPKAEGHVRYDDMHDFGQALHEARLANPGRNLVLFKSDVQGAFLNLPAHPLWQLHQVVEVDGVLHIVQLLILWEFVGCPSEDKKQEHGSSLKIIGFWVNASLGSISLSPESIADIITKIEAFIKYDGRQPPLREWQKLGGYLNWMLNVLPWARPAL
ncbi:hypothetical protein DFH06DRAFT_973665, partial [Mycena polygramma]